MRQVVLERPGLFVNVDAVAPRPSDGEALVRVRRVGVCGTDLHAFEGRQPFFTYPRILGHELAVEVINAPPGSRGIAPGDRCAVEPYLSCGECRACRIGKPNCCENLRVMGVHVDGGMRSLMAVPVDRLYQSNKLSFDQLALVEMLGVGAHAVTRSGLQAGEEVLVVGAGPVGLSVLQFAMAERVHVRVLETIAARRRFAGGFGVETLATPDGQLADVVFDATGNPKAMEQSFNLVAHGGRLVFVGLAQASISFDDPSFHRRELTLLASRNSANNFPGIIRMIEQGQISTARWITHRISLAEVPERFAGLMQQNDRVKAMVEILDPEA